MKRRMKLSIVLALIIGATLSITSDQSASAQGQMRPVADSGVITLGRNQVLRMTVVAGDSNGGGNVRVRFKQIKYATCSASPKLCIQSQTTSDPITLAPNEAAVDPGDWISDGYGAWRTVILSSSRDVKVQGIVFDTATQRVVALFDAGNCGLGLFDARDCG